MTDLLFVCTGNICRSPMAAAMAELALRDRLPGLSVRSTGVLESGREPTRLMIEVMESRGFDLAQHRSAELTASLRYEPDLIVGMAREHVWAVLDSRPDLVARAFTLKELIRRAAEAGPRPPEIKLDDYLAQLAESRKPAELVQADADDIEDPIGGPAWAYERCAEEIEGLIRKMVDYLWPADSLLR